MFVSERFHMAEHMAVTWKSFKTLKCPWFFRIMENLQMSLKLFFSKLEILEKLLGKFIGSLCFDLLHFYDTQ